MSSVSSTRGGDIRDGGTNTFHCSVRDLRLLSATSEWNWPGCELMMKRMGAGGGEASTRAGSSSRGVIMVTPGSLVVTSNSGHSPGSLTSGTFVHEFRNPFFGFQL